MEIVLITKCGCTRTINNKNNLVSSIFVNLKNNQEIYYPSNDYEFKDNNWRRFEFKVSLDNTLIYREI